MCYLFLPQTLSKRVIGIHGNIQAGKLAAHSVHYKQLLLSSLLHQEDRLFLKLNMEQYKDYVTVKCKITQGLLSPWSMERKYRVINLVTNTATKLFCEVCIFKEKRNTAQQ